MEYDTQIWVIPDYQTAILNVLNNSQRYYTNIEILSLQKIADYMQSLK